jgi:putative tryptophan/tyrosine transport system substrate-binding protein
VFVVVTDPVGQGLVQSLPLPGGNLTGFTNFEFEMGGKWLQLLKEIMPQLTRVTVLFHPRTAPYAGLFLGPIQSAARAHSIEALASSTENEGDIANNIEACARYPSSGLIVIPSVFMTVHREVIVRLAARFRVPALYPFRYYATSGGPMSYGVDVTETFRRAASYVNRILKGEKPGDLPVQQPNKFDLVINLKTAKALGLDVSLQLQQRADEVIE